MWHARVFGGLAVLALGIAVIFFSRQLPYHSDCAVVVTAQELRALKQNETFFQPRTRMAIKVLLVIATTFLLFPFLGFSVGFGVFICATMRLMGGHRWVTCAVAAIGTAVSIHFLFGHWLGIPLPTGLVGW
jgi:tripartite tricarboxylate transporter TctB family protein